MSSERRIALVGSIPACLYLGVILQILILDVIPAANHEHDRIVERLPIASDTRAKHLREKEIEASDQTLRPPLALVMVRFISTSARIRRV